LLIFGTLDSASSNGKQDSKMLSDKDTTAKAMPDANVSAKAEVLSDGKAEAKAVVGSKTVDTMPKVKITEEGQSAVKVKAVTGVQNAGDMTTKAEGKDVASVKVKADTTTMDEADTAGANALEAKVAKANDENTDDKDVKETTTTAKSMPQLRLNRLTPKQEPRCGGGQGRQNQGT
jgi:hypothetical protein